MVLITKESIITFIISELEPLYDKETESELYLQTSAITFSRWEDPVQDSQDEICTMPQPMLPCSKTNLQATCLLPIYVSNCSVNSNSWTVLIWPQHIRWKYIIIINNGFSFGFTSINRFWALVSQDLNISRTEYDERCFI